MIDRQRTTAVRAASVTLVLALLAAGCSSNGGEDPGAAESNTSSSPSSPSSPSTALPTDGSSTSAGTPSGPGQTVAPLAFDASATTTLTDSEVHDIALTSELAITVNSEKLTARSVPDLAPAYEIPAETGALVDLWVAPTGRDGVLVEAASQPGEGTSTGVDTYAVRRFDIASGAVTGTAKVDIRQDARSSTGSPAAKVSAIAGDIIVLDTWPSTGSPDDAITIAASPHTTVALDMGSGELAWSAPDTRPLQVLGQVAVLSTGTPAKNGRLRGLDVESGQERWSALDGTRSAAVVGAVGELLTVAVARGSSKAAVTTIDTVTGEAGKSRPTATWNWVCHDTSTSIALCSLLGTNRVVGWDLERQTAAWALPTRDRFAPSISTVYADAAYGLVTGGRGIVLDALTGGDLAGDTGAAPAVVSSAGGLSVLGGEAVFQPAAR